jgi:hypothetical protein
MRISWSSKLAWLPLLAATLPAAAARAESRPSNWRIVQTAGTAEDSARIFPPVDDDESFIPARPLNEGDPFRTAEQGAGLRTSPDETGSDPQPDDFAPVTGQSESSQPDLYPSAGLTVADVIPFFQFDDTLQGLNPVADPQPAWGYTVFVGYDAWRGVSDGGWENNGLHTGANFGTRLGDFSDWTGIGMQIGASIGVFDWAGTDYRLTKNNIAETQGFITYGFFRKPDEKSSWSAAIVHDWMLNSNFGVFAENPLLSQLRMQLGYATSASNEFGVWGALRTGTDSRNVTGYGSTTWRSVDQISAYWHHKWFRGGPDTSISAGIPEQNRLAGGGSLGDYLITLTANAPLSDAVTLYTTVTYMHQSASLGVGGADDEAWNFSIGISLYPRRNARSNTVAGQRWMPSLPVANNGSFLVDTSRNF